MELDQHFTEKSKSAELVQSLLNRLDPFRNRRYIEPSCGGGSFVEALNLNGVHRKRIRSVEIDQKLESDIQQDFLLSTRSSLRIRNWRPEATVVIGNPPVGRNASTAKEFINKASEFANWICFIVPRSMHGGHCCGNLLPNLKLIYEQEIEDGFATTKAKCNWQEWFVFPEGSFAFRPQSVKADQQGLYEIVSKDEFHNLVIQRCGGGAGRVTTCNGTGQGKYYIRSKYRDVLGAFRKLKLHEHANLTTHQNSLSALLLDEMFKRALLKQHISDIKG